MSYKIYGVGVLRISDGKYITSRDEALWKEYHDWLSLGNTPSMDDISVKPVKSLEELRNDKMEKVHEIAASLRGNNLAGKSPAYFAWFTLKYQQAIAFNTANPAATPMITNIATASGLTPKQVSNRIIKEFDDKILIECQIHGTTLKHIIALKALTTKQELRDYNIKADWPSVSVPGPGDR